MILYVHDEDTYAPFSPEKPADSNPTWIRHLDAGLLRGCLEIQKGARS
jgi:hypothetical protein